MNSDSATPPVSDDDLIQTCMAELYDARTFTTEIQQDREDALKAYQQAKYGDEQEGQSQYVASDIRDTIEMVLPDIVEIFVAGDHPVEFEPVSDQDIDAAEAETDAVRHVYLQQNEGFINTYSAVKDALLAKNPYWYVGWESNYSYSREEYQGLSEMQMVLLSQDPDIELRAVAQNDMGVDPMTGQPITSFDVLVRRKRTASQVCVYSLPPERVWVNRHHSSVSLQDARCVCYEELVVAGDLVEQGVPQEIVDSIPSYQWFARREEITRWRKEGGLGRESVGRDPSRRVLQILNFYIRTDFDGDGIPELRLVRIGGENSKIMLDNKEIDTIPIVSGAININTHKHYGNALADALQDVQMIRTSIMRQALNNTYFNNFPVTYVNESAASENTYQDLLSRRPAGFVRAGDINGIRTEPPALMVQPSIDMLTLVDTVREDRTGVSRATNGLDPNAISDATNLVGMTILSRSQNRIKMMARIFAETGFKNLMLAIHELLMKHGSPFPIKRGQAFQQVNPREWIKRERMTVKVGTGYSNRQEKMATAEAVLAKQQLVVEAGGMNRLVTEENIFNALSDWCRAAGAVTGKYFSDPAKMPPQPPPKPDPQTMAVEVASKEAEVKAMKTAADAKLEMQKHMDDVQIKREQIASNHYLKAKELDLKFKTTEVKDTPDVESSETASDVESPAEAEAA